MVRRDLLTVLDALFDGVVVLDRQGRVEHVNSEACRVLGTSTDWAVGRSVEQLLGKEHAVTRLSRQALESGHPGVEDEVVVERRVLGPVVADVAVNPLDDAGHLVSGVAVVLRDRTISNSLRKLVSQREALDSYGLIAAGIAHELKNPLGGIRGAAELLGGRAEDERARDTAALIVREVDRITGLVDELMVFARGDALREDTLNLHFVLDGVLDLLSADPLCKHVVLERIYDPSIPEFMGDAERLTQVFLNLARNALQAMEESGGTLRICTRMTLDHRLAGVDGQHLPTLEVAVSDTGAGIPEELLDQLSTPFFTTRPTGTGLGLAVAHHWVAQHKGSLRITSRVGEGSTARVTLPLRRQM